MGLRIALVCILAGVLRIGLGFEKDVYFDDEQTSLLLSTCNHSSFIEKSAKMFGAWLPAAQWKTFISSPDQWCFQAISQDLVEHDIHPPLYFWILHIIIRLVGTGYWLGPFSNAIIAMFTTILLYLLLRTAFSDNIALYGTLQWAIASGAVFASYQARPYELFTLLTVALYLVDLSPYMRKRTQLFWYIVIITLGGLTHYQFSLVVASLIFSRLIRQEDIDSAYSLTLATTIAVFIILYINPRTFISVASGLGRVEDQLYLPLQRIVLVCQNLLGFAIKIDLLRHLYGDSTIKPIAILILVTIIYALYYWKTQYHLDYMLENRAIGAITLRFSLLTAFVVGFYILGFTPESSMVDHRYMAPIYPGCALALTILFDRRFNQNEYKGVLLASFTISVSAIITIATIVAYFQMNVNLKPVDRLKYMIVDVMNRTDIVSSTSPLSDNTLVYVDTQSNLLSKPQQWINKSTDPSELGFAVGASIKNNNRSALSTLLNQLENHFPGTKPLPLGEHYYLMVKTIYPDNNVPNTSNPGPASSDPSNIPQSTPSNP